MVKRVFFIGLLGIGLTALGGTEAYPAVCVLKISGVCVKWSGSVECGITATGIGNVETDPVFLGCTATGTGTWLVACGNPGSNTWTSPGVNLVYFDRTLSGVYQLTPSDVGRNGRAYADVFAKPDQGLLDALSAQGACPNLNWTAIDAVPCKMTARDVQLDQNGCVTADAWYDCILPDCSTLAWDSTLQKFERRQYQCNQTSKNTYKTPLCPP